MLGISASTLRRWADAGGVKSFTTPGGHRRFSRSAIEALVPADHLRRPTMDRLGETPERIVRVYRREIGHETGELPWIRALADEERVPLRDHGRRIATALLASLDAATPKERATRLLSGVAAAEEYGRVAARHGVSLTDTVEVFLRFRRPFMHELAALARRQGLSTADATELFGSATDALDRLLVATMRAHDGVAAQAAAGSGGIPGSTGREPPR